ncbi:MAG: ATPase [Polynucleobacter sp. 24-46-87]|jgi:predicted kinase|uniref:AAA family ATPase n=1 Tax=Polynucleobacter sp. 35-46-11 TaxID=1970425 RepID=UPI000BC58FA3|nr:ATP-binding protein [Polynucleobacter sp. 35-46-11]OYY07177.1 MAG: ATPase [Polynucleobacter sp. 35-46-11]OZA03945.1 MAG: ATPase [Polynucleobacter sp. 24-46-87]OZB41460.1 MAG: ATPase [Polynucleobacter sp. 39-45-136]
MTCKLSPSAPRLILFAGHAGTGKSTLAKKALPLIVEKTGEDFFFLDKDTAYGAFSSHIMELTTNNPNDRDSPYYLKHLRDWEYAGLIAIAKENLQLGVNVILVGPFSSEIQSGRMFDPEGLGIPRETSIRIAWIDLDENEAKRRMENRADPRDEWKLVHWKEYIKRRVEPPTHESIKRFDNLHFDQNKFNKLIEYLSEFE